MGSDRQKQGLHPDPMSPGFRPPDLALMPAQWRSAMSSPEMASYRLALATAGSTDVRQGVLDDLATYHGIDVAEALHRCLHWEALSVDEWRAGDRSTPEGIRDFYNSTQSWSFDLLWYAYLQAAGCNSPVSVVAAMALPGPDVAPVCLDFGSGAGDMAQLLMALNYQVDLADVSKPLLSFAEWRLRRRGQEARFIDLNDEQIGQGCYDVIVAKDVLPHVTDFAATVAGLHRALRPSGILLTTLDIRKPQTPENAWHLYADDLPLRRILRNTGFTVGKNLGCGLQLYHRVEPTGIRHLVRRAGNRVLFSVGVPVLKFASQIRGRTVRLPAG